jgi:hypothetical protein
MTRAVRVAASDVAAAIGRNPFRTPLQVHARIVQGELALVGRAVVATRDQQCPRPANARAVRLGAQRVLGAAAEVLLAARQETDAVLATRRELAPGRAFLRAEVAGRGRAAGADACARVAAAAAAAAAEVGDAQGEHTYALVLRGALARAAQERQAARAHAARARELLRSAPELLARSKSEAAVVEACAEAQALALEALRRAHEPSAVADLAAAAASLSKARETDPFEEALGAGVALEDPGGPQYGLVHESADLDLATATGLLPGPVVGRNSHLHALDLRGDGGPSVRIVGRIDGHLADGTVVEAKRRMHRFIGVPPHERIQVETYLRLTGASSVLHLETFRKQQRVTHIEPNDALWAEVQERLRTFALAHASAAHQ